MDGRGSLLNDGDKDMKKNKYLIIICLVVFSIVGYSIIWDAELVQAVEEGGQVQTNAGVVFFSEDSSSASSSSENIPNATSTPNTSNSTNEKIVEKPAGKYPSTGELAKRSISISGLLLVIVGLVLLGVKRKQHEKGG